MSADDSQDVTDLSLQSTAGNLVATKRLMDLLYHELRALAHAYLRNESPGNSLEPTALVHEAYLKLIDQKRVDWQGRTHFFAIGAQAMRRILIDHARERKRFKRGGNLSRVPISDDLGVAVSTTQDYVELSEILEKLRERDARQAKIVELRFFGGMKMDDIAQYLNVSKRSVEADWTMAKAWLRREMQGDDSQ